MTTDQASGPQGVIDIGASARARDRHQGQLRARLVPRRRRLRHGPLRPAGRSRRSSPTTTSRSPTIILKFMQRVLWGKRQDGSSSTRRTATAARSTRRTSSPTCVTQIVDFEPGCDEHAHLHAVQRHRRAAGLLRPLRLPARPRRHRPLPAARRPLLIVRDLFVNEEVFHWSDVCDGAAPLLHAARGHRPRRRWASTRSGSTTSPPRFTLPEELRAGHHRRRGLRPREVGHPDGRGLPGQARRARAAPREDPAGHLRHVQEDGRRCPATRCASTASTATTST